jgi:DNA-binding GntR family transcriptional regulator
MKMSLKQKAYEHILSEIISGKIEPGKRLCEVSLAKTIGISPTPLREAFRQLTAEGILEHRPNSGIIVAAITTQKINELYEVREALESFCVRQAAVKMNRLDTDRLKQCLTRQTAVANELKKSGRETFSPAEEMEYIKADAEFHLLILASAENSIINKTMRECHILGRLLGFNSHKHTLEQVSTTIKQHQEILKYIKKQNPDKAERWIKAHIHFSRNTALANRKTDHTADDDRKTYSEKLYNAVYKLEEQQ